MPDHRAFLASLTPAAKSALTERANVPGFARLTTHLAAITTTGTLIVMQVPLWPLLLPVHGILLTFLFALEHEATHKTPFANERLNEWAGRAAGLVLVLPFTWFRYFHLAHHRHTNDPVCDPELLAGAKPHGWPAYLLHVSGLPYWAGTVRKTCGLALNQGGDDFVPAPARARAAAEARWMLVIYAALGATLVVSPLLVWLWIVPMLLGQPFLRLFLLAEHGRCPYVADMFENTRTTFTTRFVRWLSWNMSYHIEHHAFPSVPFHKLPDLHDLAAEHLRQTEHGYARFHRAYVGAFR
ncbi:MAG: fatty acid desaturase [Rhodobacter sp.]|nr:fatty acid desaturase [Rhodobacter sp.]